MCGRKIKKMKNIKLRAALLTGLYPYKLGIQRGNVSPFRPYGLAARFKLLPEMLRERGYSTHLVGRNETMNEMTLKTVKP